MKVTKRSTFNKQVIEKDLPEHLKKVDNDLQDVTTFSNSLTNRIIMKDTTDGKQYKIQITSGAIVLTLIS